MTPFMPKRFEAIAFGFVLSALMSFMLSFISSGAPLVRHILKRLVIAE
jgi:hypothetical protein